MRVGLCRKLRSSHADLRLKPLECLLQKKQTFKLPYRGNASTVRHGLLWTTINLACPTLSLLWVCGFVLVPYLGPLTQTHRQTRATRGIYASHTVSSHTPFRLTHGFASHPTPRFASHRFSFNSKKWDSRNSTYFVR